MPQQAPTSGSRARAVIEDSYIRLKNKIGKKTIRGERANCGVVVVE